MINTPKSLRLQIGLFGRTNVGKSSFLNLIANQDVAMVSPIPGTTTDVVEKPIELLPIGPITFLDTAGIDDETELGKQRIERTLKIFDRADIITLIVAPNEWSEFEDFVFEKSKEKNKPLIIVINKIDISAPKSEFVDILKEKSQRIIAVSSVDFTKQNKSLSEYKSELIEALPADYLQPPPLIGDLLPAGGLAIFIVPIDLQAPKGRLILPQVQSIRDVLDNDATVLVVKEREYAHALTLLNRKPDIVVCDSQVSQKMTADTPDDIKCTTFSILFARNKGDIIEEAKGVAALDRVKSGDKILIAEACSHHALEDDIGRVKIPRWLRQYLGEDIQIDIVAGRDFPENLSEYKVVINCGGCMLTRNEKLARIHKAKASGVPTTNYGMTIALTQGVIKRVLSPFPAALDAFEEEMEKND